MTKEKLILLLELLQEFREEDFGEMKNFMAGTWCRDNLAEMTRDVQTEIYKRS